MNTFSWGTLLGPGQAAAQRASETYMQHAWLHVYAAGSKLCQNETRADAVFHLEISTSLVKRGETAGQHKERKDYAARRDSREAHG